MTLRHKKTCRNKLTLLSDTLMFRPKEKFSVFRNFFDQWNFSIEGSTFLHCSALENTNIFVQSSLDITFHVIECGVTGVTGDFPFPHSTERFRKCCRNIPSKYCKIVEIFWNKSLILLKYCKNLAGSAQNMACEIFSKYWKKN